MKRGKLEAIIFDMGGTIYDSTFEAYPIHIRLLEEIEVLKPGEMTAEELEKKIHNGPEEWFVSYVLENKPGQHWNPPTEFWVEYDKQILMMLGVQENLEELAIEFQDRWENTLASPECASCYIERCTPVFENLIEEGYKLGIASNRFTDPEPRLVEDGIRKFFETVQYTATPGFAKPNPYMLIVAAAELGVNPLKCVYVGNKVKFDVASARRAEMLPVLVTWCTPEEAKLVDSETIVIETMLELSAALGKTNEG
jgi:HAD superfamily hydrolase (TIGR01549 family)